MNHPATASATPHPDDELLGRADNDVVLIVDDMPDNLAVLHDALDESGYTVLVATSGDQALQRAGQARPDIVLLDAMMPGMDGFEVARRLKADPATTTIPIIFMTGLTETEHLVAGLEAGGVDYVTKPVKARELIARIGVHLGGARRARHQASQSRQARNALDAFGYASVTARASDGRLLWTTPLARDLLQPPGAKPVGPRITNMPDQQPRVAEQGHDQRGAHAGVLRVGVGRVEDGTVGVVDADVHRTPHVLVARLGAGFTQPAAQFAANEGRGHVAGHFTGVVAAHAVGQHGQRGVGVDGDRVLVVAARAARVDGGLELEGQGHSGALG